MDSEDILSEYHDLVKIIARSAHYSTATIDFNDLCQVGDMAVLRAVTTYNPTCGMNIRSYVAKLIRQDIYNEAARFLGVFTVDHRVTSLASRANTLHVSGMSDQEIAEILSGAGQRNFDAEHVHDLRLTYERRHQMIIHDEVPEEAVTTDESTIRNLLKGVVQCQLDQEILDSRIMGTSSVKDLSQKLGISYRKVYAAEQKLRDDIVRAIEDII